MTTEGTVGSEFGVYDLPQRNAMATDVIRRIARSHAAVDAGLGLLGFLPIPGAAPATMVAALVAQVPIYKRLAAELRVVYEQLLPDAKADWMVGSGMVLDSAVSLGSRYAVNAGLDVASGMAGSIAEQFGSDFMMEISGELAREVAAGFAVAFLPVIGGFVSAAIDIKIANVMTWRVGTMVALYYQNGGKWIGSRRETYDLAKELTGKVSKKNDGRVDLDAIPGREPSVKRHQAAGLAEFTRSLLEIRPDLTDTQIRDILSKKNAPVGLVEEVIRLARA